MSCTRASEASLFARVEEAERLLGISRSLGYELPNEWIDTGGRTGLPGLRPRPPDPRRALGAGGVGKRHRLRVARLSLSRLLDVPSANCRMNFFT